MIQNIPKGSIPDVKKSSMDIFKKSAELEQGVYILNRNDIAGVMISQEGYENLLDKINQLEEELLEAEASRRIIMHDSQEKPKTYSLEEVGIDLSDVEYDESDGWE